MYGSHGSHSSKKGAGGSGSRKRGRKAPMVAKGSTGYAGKTKAPGDGVPGGGVSATIAAGGGIRQRANAAKRAIRGTKITKRR